MQMTVKPVMDQMTMMNVSISSRVFIYKSCKLTSTLRNLRKHGVHKCIDNKASNIVGNVNEELMPTLGLIRLDGSAEFWTSIS